MSYTAQLPPPPAFPQLPPAMEGAAVIERAWDEMRRLREWVFHVERWARAVQAYVNTLMVSGTYDADSDGVVDNAEAVGGAALTALMQKATYDTDSDGQVDVADQVTFLVTQAAHGLTVRTPIYHNGTSWAAAKADAAGTLAVGVIVAVPTSDTFRVSLQGKVSNASHGLTVGAIYYLSPSSAGTLTTTRPTTPNFIQEILVPISANLLAVRVGAGIVGP